MPAPSNTQSPHLLTTTRIADRLGVSVKRVEYILRTRRYIQPAAYAGNVRLFDEGGAALIQMELQDIAASRAQKRQRQEGGTHENGLF